MHHASLGMRCGRLVDVDGAVMPGTKHHPDLVDGRY